MRTHHHQLIAVLALLACGRPPPPEPLLVEMKPEPTLDRSGLTGLAVVPGTRERLWLKNGVGVLDATGKVVMPDPRWYDDLVALDAERVALITINDGFVFELATHRLLNRFCYLPDSAPLGTNQQSNVVGWDPVEQRLYVQPQTFDNGTRVGAAQVGVFAADQATPLEWQVVGEPEMQAGGIAVESRQRIWLGWRSTLYLYDAAAKKVVKAFSLQARNVSALALDGDQLLVLDQGGELSSLPLATLR